MSDKEDKNRKVLFVRDCFVDGDLVESGTFATLEKADAVQVVNSGKALHVTKDNEADLKKHAADLKKQKSAASVSAPAAGGVPAGYVPEGEVQAIVDKAVSEAVSVAVEKAVANAMAKQQPSA